MNKKNESIMFLYKAYLKEKKDKEFVPDQDALKKGILINSNCNQEIKDLAINMWGIDGFVLNQTFHKSVDKVINTDIEDLFIEQIIHYFTTYGFEELGIFNTNHVYIPKEELDVPGLTDRVKLTVINPITKDELKDKLWSLIGSSIPLGSATVEYIIKLIPYLDVNEDNIDKVKNREVKTALYDKLKIIPSDAIEFLRYLIYKQTEKTLLIKDIDTIFSLKYSDKSIALKLFNSYEEKYGLIPLAEIFNRYKQLFIALKTSESCIKVRNGKQILEYPRRRPTELKLNSIINRISKLSKEYHKPYITNDLDKLIVWYKENSKKSNCPELLKEKLVNEPVWRTIKLRNYISMVNRNMEEKVYKIRNGRTWVTNKNQEIIFDKEIVDILDNIIVDRLKPNVNKKRIYMDNDIDLVLPQSEKQFVGNIPFSSSVEVKKDNLLVGIHWLNIKDHRVDLDLKIISNEYSIGWDAEYKEGDKLVFTGDVTDAPYPNGASEYIYIDKSIGDTVFSLKINNYTKNFANVEYDIIVAKKGVDELKNNYVVDPNDILIKIPKNVLEQNKTEHSLGNIIIKDDSIKLVFTDLSTSNRRSSKDNDVERMLRKYLVEEADSKCKLKDYLKLAGATITNNKNNIDIDLGIESLNKNTIIDLFK